VSGRPARRSAEGVPLLLTHREKALCRLGSTHQKSSLKTLRRQQSGSIGLLSRRVI